MAKMSVAMSVTIPPLHSLVKSIGIDERGPVQACVTSEVLKRLPTYMPRQTGALISKVHKISPTLIQVDGPYARFLHFGITRTGKPVNYSLNQNPQAGPHWDRRLAAAEGKTIAAAAQKVARSVKR